MLNDLTDRDRSRTEQELLALRPVLGAEGLTLGLAAADPSAVPAGPGEERLAAGMFPRRRLEFLAGRCAVRRALTEAGLPAGEILYEDRRPRLPAGAVGSISHSQGLAVAVAATEVRFRALGCDLELRGLPVEAAHIVLTEDERAWAAEAGTTRRLLEAFSAKEVAFKAFSALLPKGEAPTTLLGIAARPMPGGFRTWPRPRPDCPLEVRVRQAGPGVLSWAAVPTDQPAARYLRSTRSTRTSAAPM